MEQLELKAQMMTGQLHEHVYLRFMSYIGIHVLNRLACLPVHVFSIVHLPRRPRKRQRVENMPHSAMLEEMIDQIGCGTTGFAGAHKMASAAIREGLRSPAVAAFLRWGRVGHR